MFVDLQCCFNDCCQAKKNINKTFNYNMVKTGNQDFFYQAVRPCCPGQPWGGWLIRDH